MTCCKGGNVDKENCYLGMRKEREGRKGRYEKGKNLIIRQIRIIKSKNNKKIRKRALHKSRRPF